MKIKSISDTHTLHIADEEGGVIAFEPGTVFLDPETGEFTRED